MQASSETVESRGENSAGLGLREEHGAVGGHRRRQPAFRVKAFGSPGLSPVYFFGFSLPRSMPFHPSGSIHFW